MFASGLSTAATYFNSAVASASTMLPSKPDEKSRREMAIEQDHERLRRRSPEYFRKRRLAHEGRYQAYLENRDRLGIPPPAPVKIKLSKSQVELGSYTAEDLKQQAQEIANAARARMAAQQVNENIQIPQLTKWDDFVAARLRAGSSSPLATAKVEGKPEEQSEAQTVIGRAKSYWNSCLVGNQGKVVANGKIAQADDEEDEILRSMPRGDGPAAVIRERYIKYRAEKSQRSVTPAPPTPPPPTPPPKHSWFVRPQRFSNTTFVPPEDPNDPFYEPARPTDAPGKPGMWRLYDPYIATIWRWKYREMERTGEIRNFYPYYKSEVDLGVVSDAVSTHSTLVEEEVDAAPCFSKEDYYNASMSSLVVDTMLFPECCTPDPLVHRAPSASPRPRSRQPTPMVPMRTVKEDVVEIDEFDEKPSSEMSTGEAEHVDVPEGKAPTPPPQINEKEPSIHYEDVYSEEKTPSIKEPIAPKPLQVEVLEEYFKAIECGTPPVPRQDGKWKRLMQRVKRSMKAKQSSGFSLCKSFF